MVVVTELQNADEMTSWVGVSCKCSTQQLQRKVWTYDTATDLHQWPGRCSAVSRAAWRAGRPICLHTHADMVLAWHPPWDVRCQTGMCDAPWVSAHSAEWAVEFASLTDVGEHPEYEVLWHFSRSMVFASVTRINTSLSISVRNSVRHVHTCLTSDVAFDAALLATVSLLKQRQFSFTNVLTT